MKTQEQYLVRKMVKRVFEGLIDCVANEQSQDPEVIQTMNKAEEVIIDVISRELSDEERFHYLEAIRHSLTMSKERYMEVNQIVYNNVIKVLT